MRVLMVEPTGRGGMYTYTDALSVGLCDAFANVDVAVLTTGSSKTMLNRPYNVKKLLFEIMERKADWSQLHWAVDRFLRCMGNSLKRNRFAIYDCPDVVHIQIGVPVIDQFLLKPLARRFPVVLTVHDVQPHSEHFSSKHSFLRRFFSIPSRLIVHYEGGKSKLVENWGVYADRIDVIPHGIIPIHNTLDFSDARKRLNLPLDREIVLLFGSIRANKGLSVLLKALEIVRLQNPRILLVVAGSVPRGVNFEPYSNIIERSNLSKHVQTFLWFIDDDDVDIFFAASNIVVLPYLKFESQSGVLLRAYAHKKPVVVSNVGAMGELVSVDNVGLVVEPGEPESLAMAIVSVLHDTEKFKAHYTNELESKYSWRHIAELTMRSYEMAIKGRNLS